MLSAITIATIILFGIVPVIFPKKEDVGKHSREVALSFIFFDEQGVHKKRIGSKGYSITWDECVDIGWGYLPYKGKGVRYCCLYFSSKPLPLDMVDDMTKITPEYQCLWLTHSEDLVDDVLQYIEKDRISRFRYIDMA